MEIKVENKFHTAKRDKIFKAIYCNEKNIHLTKYFLKKVLKEDVNVIGFLNTELNARHALSRTKIVDSLICTDDKMIHIEVNSNGCASYLKPRNFTFFTEIYGKKTLVGKKYVEDIFFIHFDFTYNLPKRNKDLIRIYDVMDKNGNKYIKNFKIIEYNMDKIMNFWYDEDEKNIIKYIHLITLALDLKELDKLFKKYKLPKEDDIYMKEFLKELKELNKEDYFVSSISKEQDLEMIANTERDFGYKKGIEKGIKKGIKQGIEQGIEQGSKKTLLETAKNLIKIDLPLNKISEATGLSMKELKKLKTTIF